MWKVIILSAFLSICQAAKTSDIFGTYTAVIGSSNDLPPMCTKLSFAEDSRKTQCTCSDGINSTLVEMRLLETLPPQKYGRDDGVISLPMIVIEPETELNDAVVVSLCNVTCDCAGKVFNNRAVVKVVNQNYNLVSYILDGAGHFRKLNYLLARSLPSAAELQAAITLIDAEKVKNGPVLCTQEIYEGLRPKN